MASMSRRKLLACAPLLALGRPAWAAGFVYGDWKVDASAMPGGALDPAVEASLRTQCDIVASLEGRIAPAAYSFFRGLVVHLIPQSRGGAGDYAFETHRLQMTAKVDPPENPVLLHEMLHAFHDQRLGRMNPKLRELYFATKASDAFPAQAYMLKNPGEFFAMCGSVALWGKAARPPLTRENLQAKAPEVYAWIAQTFAFTG